MEDESKALNHNSDSCVRFESDCSKCKHVLLCILHLAERQEHVILSLSLCTLNMLVFIFDLGKSRGTSWWMSCFKGEQHVNRGEMKAGVASPSMKTIHRAVRPSNQAASPLIWSTHWAHDGSPSALHLHWIPLRALVNGRMEFPSWSSVLKV